MKTFKQRLVGLIIFFITMSFFEFGVYAQKVSTNDYIISNNNINILSLKEEITDSYFEIVFIDVGQADAALVICDNETLLIDGGNVADADIIYTVLTNKEIDTLNYVIGTHGHEDHIGGLPAAFVACKVENFLCSVDMYNSRAFKNLLKKAIEQEVEVQIPNAGDTFMLGSANVTILASYNGLSTNNNSIVLKIEYGETSFLFMGDAERDEEKLLLNSDFDLSADVIKVGHHGSGTSSSYAFINEVMPKYAVISVAAKNNYGHPEEETLSRFNDCGTIIYRTDLLGDIKCVSDGKKIYFQDEIINIPKYDPTLIPYVINARSNIFHVMTCSAVNRILEKNKVYKLSTYQKMLEENYIPCKICQ